MVYRFEDIIINSLEKRAGTIGDEKNYITISNVKSRDLSITEWGVPEPFFDERLIVKKGDVLFIKRDPSNHQVGISPIDGLFTGYGMVLRPKQEVILPEFLPYFIFSDRFIEKASSIAVGTKYKTCNWTELKSLEFDIPSLEDQSKIIRIIKEIETLNDHYHALISDLEQLPESYLMSITSEDCQSVPLGKLMSLQTKTEKVPDKTNIDYITYDEIANKSKKRQNQNSSVYVYRLKTGQIITPRNAFCKGSMALIEPEHDGFFTANTSQVFNINKDMIIPEYLFRVLTRRSFVNRLENIELSANNWNTVFSLITLEIPTLALQQKYLNLYHKVRISLENTIRCKEQTYNTMQSVLCEHIS